jgi:hypothetical protein
MIHVILRASEKINSLIPSFKRFLKSYDLYVINHEEDNSTIELVINSVAVDEIKRVNQLAVDFFSGELIKLKVDL